MYLLTKNNKPHAVYTTASDAIASMLDIARNGLESVRWRLSYDLYKVVVDEDVYILHRDLDVESQVEQMSESELRAFVRMVMELV